MTPELLIQEGSCNLAIRFAFDVHVFTHSDAIMLRGVTHLRNCAREPFGYAGYAMVSKRALFRDVASAAAIKRALYERPMRSFVVVARMRLPLRVP